MHQPAQCFRLPRTAWRRAGGTAFRWVFLSCSIDLFAVFSTPAIASADIYLVDLERQPLVSALNKLAEIVHLQWWSLNSVYFQGESAGPIRGYYTARQAVAELFKGTGIQYEWSGDDGLLITGKQEVKKAVASKPAEPVARIEEITVIGSHIRGAQSAAPVYRFNRTDIENSAPASTQAFLNGLPQVFGGGAAEGAIFPIKGEGARFNIASANGINLLGMGYDSTLVLINGHRIAPVGFGDVVDLSGIPPNAIERIDILADGASAIYGSDAVGGVVNIILRKHLEGNETRVGFSDVTSGSNETYRIAHTYGERWPSGNALLSYTYRHRADLDTEQRRFTQSATDPSDILGENTRFNTLFSFSRQLTQRADVYVDALYSARDTDQHRADFGGANYLNSTVLEQYSLVGGSGINLSDRWRMDTSILYSGSSMAADTLGAFNSTNKTTLDTWLWDIKVDGDLFSTWGDTARLALGGQYRRETFAFDSESAAFVGEDNAARGVTAVFTELFVPLVAAGKLPGVRRLEFTLAGRYERYSDFGGSASPKVGLLWSPGAGLRFRGTYSKSFRAPLLFELSDVVNPPRAVAVLPVDPGNPDHVMPPTLLISGYNVELQPERAVNWTAGVDLTLPAWSGVQLSFTYFAIDFSDRIQTALQGPEFHTALIDPRFDPVVIRNPAIDLIDFWASRPYFENPSGISPLSDIRALIDNRLLNIAAVRERGLDFSLEYALYTAASEFVLRVSGTYLLALEYQVTEAAPYVDLLDMPYHPVKLKLRNSASWSRNGLTATAFLNYVGSYKDTRPGREKSIDAWPTVDLTFRYDLENSERFRWGNVTIVFGVNNLFDKEPPFVADSLGYNFDAANANALGRRISLDIVKRW